MKIPYTAFKCDDCALCMDDENGFPECTNKKSVDFYKTWCSGNPACDLFKEASTKEQEVNQ
jgi:hypothetical protein